MRNHRISKHQNYIVKEKLEYLFIRAKMSIPISVEIHQHNTHAMSTLFTTEVGGQFSRSLVDCLLVEIYWRGKRWKLIEVGRWRKDITNKMKVYREGGKVEEVGMEVDLEAAVVVVVVMVEETAFKDTVQTRDC
eukprot:7398811-Ditylum_brightwellii.AAC.1